MIHVFMIDSSPLCEELFFQKIYQNLSPERKAKVDAMKVASGKRLSAAAGYLYDTYHEMGTYSNLSHSGELAVIAVSDKPIGVDVERIKPPKEGVLNKCYSEEEKTLIAEDSAFANLRFTEFWTRKESACKRSGEGLAGILSHADGMVSHALSFQSIVKKINGDAYVITVCFKEE